MGDIFIYVFVAIACMFGHYYTSRNTLHTAIIGVLGVVVGVSFYYGTLIAAATSTEIWNGQVVNKKRVYDPYSETYTCGHDSKGNAITCTRWIPRWRFDVISNIGETWSEHRSSKNDVPSIYSYAESGKPFAATKMFMNYQYVSEQQIHVDKADAYEGWLPEYPEIYKGFQVNHALSNAVSVNNLDAMLAWAHKRWGPKYGVNVTVCIVNEKAAGFSNALRNKWVGGKKNDAVVTIYIDAEENVKNVEVFSRSTRTKRDAMQASFDIALRESVSKVKTYEFEEIVNAIEVALPLFEREDLSQYDYLATDYQASVWIKILGVLVVVAMCCGASVWLHRNVYTYNRRRYGR